MKKKCLLFVALVFCSSFRLHAEPQPSSHVEDLIAAILGPDAEKKHPRPTPPRKPKESKPASTPTSVPAYCQLSIPEDELLAVDAKFPKNYVGKFVYGQVKLTYFQSEQYTDLDPYVTFAASNNRGFYLDFQDPEMVRRLSKYRRGDVFVIPKEHPLRIVGRSPIPFGPYWLKLPSESSPEIKP
jgi:hypothetical protein